MARLLANIDALHEARLRYMYATATLVEWEAKSAEEHSALLDAVGARDVEAACALLEKHIDDAGQILAAAVGELQR
jgi:DNA-binding GntR family transcriptional regulator